MRIKSLLPLMVSLAVPVAACTGGNGSPGAEARSKDTGTTGVEASWPEARSSEASPPDALADTWASTMQTYFADYCVRCHGSTTVSPSACPTGETLCAGGPSLPMTQPNRCSQQNFNCLNWFDPATGKCVATGTAGTQIPGVAPYAHEILCGIHPASDSEPTCPDTCFTVPVQQFPADCSQGTITSCPTAGASGCCPDDAQRQAVVNWIKAGMP